MTEFPQEVLASPGESDIAGFASPNRRRGKLPLGAMEVSPAPLPLAGKDRAPWRVAGLLLCLAACRGRSASFEQLHVLQWAIRDRRNEERLFAVWQRRPGAPRVLRAWDPLLEDSLRLARAAGLIKLSSTGRHVLSESGDRVVRAIRSSPEPPLQEEQMALARLGRISESSMWERLGLPKKPSEHQGGKR